MISTQERVRVQVSHVTIVNYCMYSSVYTEIILVELSKETKLETCKYLKYCPLICQIMWQQVIVLSVEIYAPQKTNNVINLLFTWEFIPWQNYIFQWNAKWFGVIIVNSSIIICMTLTLFNNSYWKMSSFSVQSSCTVWSSTLLKIESLSTGQCEDDGCF